MRKLLNPIWGLWIQCRKKVARDKLMKVLFLTTQFPYPLDNGGKIGAYNGLEVLSDYDVTVLSFTEQPEYIANGIEFYSKYNHISFIDPILHDVHIQNKKIQLIRAVICSLFGKYPYLCTKFVNKKMFQTIDSLLEDNTYDLVFVDYLNMEIYGDYIRRKYGYTFKKYILKDHNIEFEIIKQAAESSNAIKNILMRPLWKKTLKYENKALAKADIVFSVCEENTSYMKKYNPSSYTMKPVFTIKPYAEHQMNHRLLYIGNLSWKPNMDGLIWFVKYVWNSLKDEFADLEFDIIGSGKVENPFTKNIGINWLGFVENLDDIYDAYQIFIVPLFEGSGIRIKILEAFNYNIPVVSTGLASATIGARNGVELLIADTAEDFKKQVSILLENESMCRDISYRAKMFLKDYYSVDMRKIEIAKILAESFNAEEQ